MTVFLRIDYALDISLVTGGFRLFSAVKLGVLAGYDLTFTLLGCVCWQRESQQEVETTKSAHYRKIQISDKSSAKGLRNA